MKILNGKYKDIVANIFMGKTIHARCNCMFNLDVIGVVDSYYISNNEIIYVLKLDSGKTIQIGENTFGLSFEIIK